MASDHCPQTAKIYTIIMFCLVFTSTLTSVSVISRTSDNKYLVDDNLFNAGVAVNVAQTMLTLYLLYKDIFGTCSAATTQSTCNNDKNCKWYDIAPNFYKCTSLGLVKGYIYLPVILLSSAYLLAFGMTMVMDVNDPNDERDITTLSIASVILGAIGMLFVVCDLGCNLGCYCTA